jgi:acyl carrier protein
MKEKVLEVIAQALEVEPERITEKSLIRDIEEWDSLAQLSVIAALEEQLKIKIPFDKVLEMEGVHDIITFIEGTK